NNVKLYKSYEQSGNSGLSSISCEHPNGNCDAESGNQRLEIIAPTDGDGNIADCIFDDQIPTDDPRNQFAQRCIGVRVRAAGDWNHRSEFCITQSCESAGDGCEYK